jgi:subtilisin family serine protease
MTSRVRVLLLALACLALTVAGVGGGLKAAPQQQPPGLERVNVFIGFDRTPGPGEQALVQAAGGRLKYSYQLVPAIAANLPAAALNGLRNNPNVTYIEADAQVTAFDTELDNTWGVKQIGAGDAHLEDPPIVGSGVLVAVLDTGIDTTHPELSGAIAPGGHDFVNNDADPTDDNGHGTHVSGTIAAAMGNGGVVGVAPGASILPLKVLDASGSGSFSDVVAALQQAVAAGARVTNSSFGSTSDPGTTVSNAYAAAAAAGIVNVAAAGNSGNCAGKNNSVGYPARYSSVIAVAATNASDGRPCFSSTGPDVELAAPGVSILSTVPGGYAVYSGTSMASPHVAGAAALLISAGITNVRAVLDSTARDLGAKGRDTLYGYGLVDVMAALGTQPVTQPPPPPPGSDGGDLSVSSPTYTWSGGKDGKKNLKISLTVTDGSHQAVSGATVTVKVTSTEGFSGQATGTTGSTGVVTFSLNNPSAGCYSTQIIEVTAGASTWDGQSPSDPQGCK